METIRQQSNKETVSPLSVPENVFRATAGSAEDLVRSYPYYKDVLAAFNAGEGEVELRKRFMLKGLDEVWVSAVEDALPALDTIIRNPGYMLQEKREVLPVERTRRVTDSSIQHLCQHTDLINEIKSDGTVVPSKLLNVYQDETVFTYENKFINTLLSRVYAFVARRYEAAEACGEDEKTTKLQFARSFEREGQKGKINLTIEVSEKPRENEVVRNYVYTTDLWHRVQKLYEVVTSYMDSSFVQTLGKSYIRPPLMRTNKILKNVNFHQCLALWEFLDSYEGSGYETIVQEDLEKLDEQTLAEIYDTMAMQYVLFQSHIHNTFDYDQVLDISDPHDVIKTKFVDELQPLDERELDVPVRIPEKAEEISEDDLLLEQAVKIALEADKFYIGEEADDEEELVFDQGKILYRYRYSFLARVIRAQDPLQKYYSDIKNFILSYNKIKSRTSWKHELFMLGRTKAAKINVRGKTLCLYLPLDPSAYAVSKYHHVDLRAQKETDDLDLPFLLKVRSERGLKYALELLGDVMAKFELTLNPLYTAEDFHMPLKTNEEMAAMVPPLVKILNEEAPAAEAPAPEPEPEPIAEEIPMVPRFSFQAKLIRLQEPVQSHYSEIKNALLAGKKVKSRMSWGHETFTLGRVKCAKITAKGKTLCLYLPLDPAQYDVRKYHHVNLLLKNEKTNADFPLLLKVKSGRSLKYALALIDEVLTKNAIPKNAAYLPADFHMAQMSTEEMLGCTPPLAKMAKQVKMRKN